MTLLFLGCGKTHGSIEANGAWQSTALRLISRIIEPTSGSITANGDVGALLELGAGFHPDFAGRANADLNGSVLGLHRDFVRNHLAEIVAFAELEELIHLFVRHYPSVVYVRLGFSVPVHTRSEILPVDEVLARGDASFWQKCLNRIARMRRAGVTITLVTHDVGTFQSLCGSTLWFDHSTLAAFGDSADVVMA